MSWLRQAHTHTYTHALQFFQMDLTHLCSNRGNAGLDYQRHKMAKVLRQQSCNLKTCKQRVVADITWLPLSCACVMPMRQCNNTACASCFYISSIPSNCQGAKLQSTYTEAARGPRDCNGSQSLLLPSLPSLPGSGRDLARILCIFLMLFRVIAAC